MKEIHSTKNVYIKEIKKLEKKKYREEKKLYKIEGFHLVEEALNANIPIESLLMTEKGYELFQDRLKDKATHIECYLISEEVLGTIASVPTPQGIVAILPLPTPKELTSFQSSVLLLDNVQDPGNVGTMIRTADAAGFQAVFLGEGCADIYSTKVLRSMQGSNFHVDIYSMNLIDAMESLYKQNIPVYGTELNINAVDYRSIKKGTVFGLVMGNEGQGVQKKILENTTKNIYIPILGQAESLNVAVAAGIIMFQLQ